MVSIIDWFAPDGRKLSFHVLQHDATWNDISGVYMFCRIESPSTYIPLYIGKAASLKDRLPLHEQWNPAVRKGASIVLAAVVRFEQDRCYFEENLIRDFQPELNVHHKESTGLLGFSLSDISRFNLK